MPIISLFVDDNTLKELDRVQKDHGWKGRSATIRTALNEFLTHHKSHDHGQGQVEGVLIVANKEKHNPEVTVLRHQFSTIIKTEVHNHLDSHRCLHLLVIKGDSKQVKSLLKAFESSKRVEFAKLFLA